MRNLERVLSPSNKMVLILVYFVLLIGVATLAPLLRQQFLTGPIVNATLFISTIILGVQAGILVGLVPSLIALSVGLLPSVLAPMVPFIMMGNAILIIGFNYLKEKNYWIGIICASILKFIFLFSTSSIVINLLLKKEVASQVAMMMGPCQLFTAIIGGIVAYLFLRIIKRI